MKEENILDNPLIKRYADEVKKVFSQLKRADEAGSPLETLKILTEHETN